MLKSVIKDGSYYFLASIISRGAGLVLFPLYAKKLNPENYAVVDLLTVFSSLCAITLSLEIIQGLFREYNEYDGEERIKVTSTVFWFSLSSTSLILIILYAIRSDIAELLVGDREKGAVVAYCILSIWLSNILAFCSAILRLSIRAKEYFVCSVIQLVATAVGTLITIYRFDLKESGVFIGIAIGAMSAIAVMLLLIRDEIKWRFDFDKLKTLLRFSVPLIPASMGVIAAMYADRYVVKEMMTMRDVGILGTAYRFASIATIVTAAISSAVTPLIYKHYKEKSTPLELGKMFEILTYFALLITMVAMTFSEVIIQFLLESQYHEAALYIPYLLLASFISYMFMFFPGLVIAKRTGVMSVVSIFGALSNLTLNVLLIPSLGLYGVVVATLSSAFGVFLLYLLLGNRHYPIIFSKCRVIGMACIFIMFTLILSFAGRGDSPTGLWLSSVMLLLAITFCSLVVKSHISSLIKTRFKHQQ